MPTRLTGRMRLPLSLTLCLLGAGASFGGPLPEPADPSKALTVEVIKAERRPALHALAATGTLEAAEVLGVAFPLGGRIMALHAEIGDRVAKGQLLAELDPVQANAGLRAAEAQLAAAEANLIQAEAAFERARGLIDRGATTRAMLDRSEQERAAALAQIDEARAGRDKMLQSFADTRILAPVDGIVTTRGADAGQVTAAGQPIFQIASDGPREARFFLPALSGLEASLGRTILVRALDDRSLTAEATITEVSPLVNSATGTREIRAKLASGLETLSLGSPLRTELAHETAAVFTLPASALVLDGAAPAVWVIDPVTAKVAIAPVEIARFTSDSVEVLSGLKDGDLVAGAGAQLLYPDRAVRAQSQGDAQ